MKKFLFLFILLIPFVLNAQSEQNDSTNMIESLNVVSGKEINSIRITFSKIKAEDILDVEISADIEFKEIVYSGMINTAQINLKLKHGNYFLRIRLLNLNSTQFVKWNEPVKLILNKLTVEKFKDTSIQKSALIKPIKKEVQTEKTVESSESKIIKSENIVLEKKITELEKEKRGLLSKVNKYKMDLAVTSKDQKSHQELLLTLESKEEFLNQLNDKISKKDAEIKKLNKALKTIESARIKINNDLTEKQKQIETIEKDSNQKILILKEELAETKKELSKLKSEKEKLILNLESSQQQSKKELISLKKNLSIEKEKLSSKINAQEISIIKLNDAIKDKETKIKNLSFLTTATETSKNKKINELDEELASALTEIKSEKENNLILFNEINHLKREILGLKKESDKLNISINEHIKNKNELLGLQEKFKKQREELLSIIKNQKNSLSKLNEIINKKDSKLKEMSIASAKNKEEKIKVDEEYKTKLKTIQEQINSVENKNSKLESELADSQKFKLELVEKINYYKREIVTRVNAILEETTGIEKENERLKKELAAVNIKIKSLEEKKSQSEITEIINKLNSEISSLKTQKTTLEEQVKIGVEKSGKYEKEILDLEKSLALKDKEINGLNNKFMVMANDFEELKNNYNKVNKIVKQKIEDVKILKNQMNKYQGQGELVKIEPAAATETIPETRQTKNLEIKLQIANEKFKKIDHQNVVLAKEVAILNKELRVLKNNKETLLNTFKAQRDKEKKLVIEHEKIKQQNEELLAEKSMQKINEENIKKSLKQVETKLKEKDIAVKNLELEKNQVIKKLENELMKSNDELNVGKQKIIDYEKNISSTAKEMAALKKERDKLHKELEAKMLKEKDLVVEIKKSYTQKEELIKSIDSQKKRMEELIVLINNKEAEIKKAQVTQKNQSDKESQTIKKLKEELVFAQNEMNSARKKNKNLEKSLPKLNEIIISLKAEQEKLNKEYIERKKREEELISLQTYLKEQKNDFQIKIEDQKKLIDEFNKKNIENDKKIKELYQALNIDLKNVIKKAEIKRQKNIKEFDMRKQIEKNLMLQVAIKNLKRELIKLKSQKGILPKKLSKEKIDEYILAEEKSKKAKEKEPSSIDIRRQIQKNLVLHSTINDLKKEIVRLKSWNGIIPTSLTEKKFDEQMITEDNRILKNQQDKLLSDLNRNKDENTKLNNIVVNKKKEISGLTNEKVQLTDENVKLKSKVSKLNNEVVELKDKINIQKELLLDYERDIISVIKDKKRIDKSIGKSKGIITDDMSMTAKLESMKIIFNSLKKLKPEEKNKVPFKVKPVKKEIDSDEDLSKKINKQIELLKKINKEYKYEVQ